GVLYFAFAGGGSGQTDTLVALVFCLAWLVIGFGYLYIRKWRTGEPILHPEDHKDKVGLPSEMVPN
ncbi:MAG: APC family permease, partial [Ktedonobacteraceae bacterium]|nr:APC family permease [Ktedonobacteraceae bacterium]